MSDELDTADEAARAATLPRAARRRWAKSRGLNPEEATPEVLQGMARRLRETHATRVRRSYALSAVLALVGGTDGPPEGQ